MKKIIISLIFVILLVGIGFVSASYSASEKQITLQIRKGWNLIPSSSFELQKYDSPIKQADFRYAFVYDIGDKKYITAIDNYKRKDMDSSWANNNWLKTSSIWVYSEKQGNYNFRWDDSVFKESYVNLTKGWNFIWISPEMKGISFKQFKGNCNIVKICDYQRNNWDCADINQFSDERILVDQDSNVGIGTIINVAESCSLLKTFNIESPPSLP